MADGQCPTTHTAGVATANTVLHPILLQTPGWSHPKSAVVVASEAGQPQDLVTVDVVVHWATKQLLQTAPVAVTVGQPAGEQGAVVVIVAVAVVVTVAMAVAVFVVVSVTVVGTVTVAVVAVVTVVVVAVVLTAAWVNVLMTVTVLVRWSIVDGVQAAEEQ
ncbi:hypothetical protein ColKHC_05903 [Colletotrichum higginsianum]|nr:hypothetical protein ColKHC_05903 [Colletotrichum higginsianum]